VNGNADDAASLLAAPRVVYVVLAHRDGTQAHRLARTILASGGDARVLIANDTRLERFADAADPRVRVLPHALAADWGSWEIVEATLTAFAVAREWADPDLVVLISGQDYPARPLAEWERQAAAADGWTGEAHELSYTPRWGRRRGTGDDTWTRYAYRWGQTPAARWGITADNAVARGWRRVRDAVLRRIEPVAATRLVLRGRGVFYGLRRRDLPADRPFFFGSQWVALRRRDLDPLLDVDYAPGSALRRLYRRSIIPDESALVTPLAWRGAASGLAPVSYLLRDEVRDRVTILSEEHFDEVTASGSPFCRKVEPGVSDALMARLDAHVTGLGRPPRSDRPRS
jgi:hypothetical protein